MSEIYKDCILNLFEMTKEFVKKHGKVFPYWDANNRFCYFDLYKSEELYKKTCERVTSHILEVLNARPEYVYVCEMKISKKPKLGDSGCKKGVLLTVFSEMEEHTFSIEYYNGAAHAHLMEVSPCRNMNKYLARKMIIIPLYSWTPFNIQPANSVHTTVNSKILNNSSYEKTTNNVGACLDSHEESLLNRN
jgi:hypothetical protein